MSTCPRRARSSPLVRPKVVRAAGVHVRRPHLVQLVQQVVNLLLCARTCGPPKVQGQRMNTSALHAGSWRAGRAPRPGRTVKGLGLVAELGPRAVGVVGPQAMDGEPRPASRKGTRVRRAWPHGAGGASSPPRATANLTAPTLLQRCQAAALGAPHGAQCTTARLCARSTPWSCSRGPGHLFFSPVALVQQRAGVLRAKGPWPLPASARQVQAEPRSASALAQMRHAPAARLDEEAAFLT